MQYSSTKIGNLVHETRKKLRVTQKELAMTAGTVVHNQYVSHGAKYYWIRRTGKC